LSALTLKVFQGKNVKKKDLPMGRSSASSKTFNPDDFNFFNKHCPGVVGKKSFTKADVILSMMVRSLTII